MHVKVDEKYQNHKLPKVGHPTHYKPEYCEMLEDHMSKGYTYESFAAVAGVSVATLYNWEDKHPEFLEAKKRAYPRRQYLAETLLLASARGQLPTSSNSALIFLLKNLGWSDYKPAQLVELEQQTTQKSLNQETLKKAIELDDFTDLKTVNE